MAATKALGLAKNCFVAGTEVLTGDAAKPGVFGETKIEDIEVGDEVWSRDQSDPDAPLELRKVTAVYERVAHDLQKVTLLSADGHAETLDATDEHPIYVDGQGWTPAGQLAVGDRAFMPDGSVMTVSASVDDYRPDGVTVYNFQVEGDHTYFVADGGGDESFVWVHNADNYRTRSVAEVAELRKEFEGGIKQKFIRDYAGTAEAVARFSEAERSAMKKMGRLPEDFYVHHKLPLFRGGNNSYANFAVLHYNDHYANGNYRRLHWYAPGHNPYGLG